MRVEVSSQAEFDAAIAAGNTAVCIAGSFRMISISGTASPLIEIRGVATLSVDGIERLRRVRVGAEVQSSAAFCLAAVPGLNFAWEFGIFADGDSSNDLRGLVEQIQSGVARPLLRQSNRVSLWLVDAGTPLVVAYDKHRKTLATVITVAINENRE